MHGTAVKILIYVYP